MNFVNVWLFCRATSYFNEMTDINLKDMLFKQRMTEIENDVLPFGFIDDGVTRLTSSRPNESRLGHK